MDVGIEDIAEATEEGGIDDKLVGMPADGGGLRPLLSKNLLSNSRLNKSAWSGLFVRSDSAENGCELTEATLVGTELGGGGKGAANEGDGP